MTVKLDSNNFDFSLSSDSSNIYFMDSSGTLLNHEVEYYSTSASKAVYHVRIPTISSTVDTKFELHIDGTGYVNGNNPTSVWDSNYLGVFHMGSTSTSTATGNNLSFIGGSFIQDESGPSRSFLAGNYASLSVNFGSSNQHSHLFLIKPSSTVPASDEQLYVIGNEEMLLYTNQGGSNGNPAYNLSAYSPSGTLFNNTPRYSSTTFTRNQYQTIAAVVNGSTFKYSKNGIVFNSLTGLTSRTLTSQTINIFRRLGGSQQTNTTAVLSEYRISNIARPDAWIKAESEFLVNDRLTVVAK
jgi:hypothetical protein